MNAPTIVTYALTYANGPLHLGHLVGHIQTDIWVRHLKAQDKSVLFLGGDDAHGTPIMLKAQQQSTTPEALIGQIFTEHQQDLQDFFIGYDTYISTHDPINQELVETIYQSLQEDGWLSTRPLQQAFDVEKGMFLPDRFVKGQCPNCDAKEQYGDHCERCGKTYTPEALINPYSTLTGSTPEFRSSEHVFFDFSRCSNLLQAWHDTLSQSAISAKLQEWFQTGLQPWCISRDAPYFGFSIPERNQYFYVWLDAPVGYLCALKTLEPKLYDALKTNTPPDFYHFIGKDILYFHGLFWPALLSASHHTLPKGLYAHGFLTIHGEKMSKSRGTFITARDYLKHGHPEALRYYLSSKLNGSIDDLDLSFEELTQKINSDIVGKWVNIASRCAKLLEKYFEGRLSDTLPDEPLYQEFLDQWPSLMEAYHQRDTAKAIRMIMHIADRTNAYLAQHQPWALGATPQAQQILTLGLNLFRLISSALVPIMPQTTSTIAQWLTCDLQWSAREQALLGTTLTPYTPLWQRLSSTQWQALTT